jgi:hypothetical protein
VEASPRHPLYPAELVLSTPHLMKSIHGSVCPQHLSSISMSILLPNLQAHFWAVSHVFQVRATREKLEEDVVGVESHSQILWGEMTGEVKLHRLFPSGQVLATLLWWLCPTDLWLGVLYITLSKHKAFSSPFLPV